MTFRRGPVPQINQTQVDLYVDFVNACHLIEPDEVPAIVAKYERIENRPWYSTAADQVYDLVKKTGRLDRDGYVVGDIADPEKARPAALTEMVDGGAAVDVALTILVADLLDDQTYTAMTGWWSRFGSTWLPEDEQPPAVLAAGPQLPEPMVVRPEPAPAPQPRIRPATAAVIPGEVIRVDDAPPPAPDPAAPVHEKLVKIAVSRAMDKGKTGQKRKWKVRRVRAAGALSLFLAVAMGLGGCSFQVGNPDVWPAGMLGAWGAGWPGRFICAMLWLVAGIGLAWLAGSRFAKATRIQRGGSW